MKKLSLILALALMLASSAFAEKECPRGKKVNLGKEHGGWHCTDSTKTKKPSDYKNECHKYEIKDDDNLYYNGKRDGDDVKGDNLAVYMVCKDKIKGYSKAKQRQEKREKERHNKPDTTIKK